MSEHGEVATETYDDVTWLGEWASTADDSSVIGGIVSVVTVSRWCSGVEAAGVVPATDSFDSGGCFSTEVSGAEAYVSREPEGAQVWCILGIGKIWLQV